MTDTVQIIDMIRKRIDSREPEHVAMQLGLELCPAPGARYVLIRKRLEYDALSSPQEQRGYIARAVVCQLLMELAVVPRMRVQLPSTPELVRALFGELSDSDQRVA